MQTKSEVWAAAQMRMTRAMKKALREKALADISAHEPMIRKKARQEVMAGIPGHKLRQGAEKMQLRRAEEAALPLVLCPLLLKSNG